MDLLAILAQLKEKKAKVDHAIQALEQLANSGEKRKRGRPKGSTKKVDPLSLNSNGREAGDTNRKQAGGNGNFPVAS